MAENKKSFLMYCDLIHMVAQMPDDKAGQLFKHIIAYVNDEDPQTDDLLIRLVFEPIKRQMKRDLIKWEETKAVRSKAGKASAEAKKQAQHMLTHVECVGKNPTKSTVNVNVNVNDINKNSAFAPPALEEVRSYFKEKGYTEQSAITAFEYYSQMGWKDRNGKPVKNWKGKMISVWFKEENRAKQKKMVY